MSDERYIPLKKPPVTKNPIKGDKKPPQQIQYKKINHPC